MKKYTVIIIAVILMIICGVGGYFFGQKLAENEDKKVVEENKKEETNKDDIKEETREKIEKRIDELVLIDYLGKNISSPNAIPIETIQKIVFKILEEQEKDYTEENFNQVTKEYFKDLKINHKDYYDGLCDEPIYKWDEKKKMYVENEEHGGHGGTGRSIYNRVEDISYEDDVYTVTVYKYISESTEFVTTRYHASIEDTDSNKNALYELSAAEIEGDYEKTEYNVKKSLAEQDTSKLIRYTYKLDSNLALISYKIN